MILSVKATLQVLLLFGAGTENTDLGAVSVVTFYSTRSWLLTSQQLNRVPVVSPSLNETSLKLLKEKHASCMEDLCAEARTVVATCKRDDIEKTGILDLDEPKRDQKSTVLRPPDQCFDAVEASLGIGVPRNLPPIFSLDPKIPAVLNVDRNCSIFLDTRTSGMNMSRFGGEVYVTGLIEMKNTKQHQSFTILSPASWVCQDQMSPEFQADIPYLLETYNWLLSSDGRSLVLNVCVAIISGLQIMLTTCQTILNTAMFTMLLTLLANCHRLLGQTVRLYLASDAVVDSMRAAAVQCHPTKQKPNARHEGRQQCCTVHSAFANLSFPVQGLA